LAHQYRALVQQYPHINLPGGCCGTDFGHVRKVCEAVSEAAARLNS
jgi:methionine synthase I (cobalamin-dependent)